MRKTKLNGHHNFENGYDEDMCLGVITADTEFRRVGSPKQVMRAARHLNRDEGRFIGLRVKNAYAKQELKGVQEHEVENV